jgi:hypothetical protein
VANFVRQNSAIAPIMTKFDDLFICLSGNRLNVPINIVVSIFSSCFVPDFNQHAIKRWFCSNVCVNFTKPRVNKSQA